ncbi:hypothetical protein [Sphingomonas sp.]|uniref:hypothetical protein n=1 Tax=Sphingomonas sp. TaxID=28214 RepID=UPI0025E17A27|nr:hypothetical protein [Sphingomonas sp.]
MSVVINEFEAVAETVPPAGGGGGEASGSKAIKPHDLVRPSSRIARRKARVWAH